MIKVIYNKVCGRCVQSEPLTSGMVGQPIELEYSSDFDGLTLTAVFTNGKTTVDVLNPDNQCVIPHEVLDTVGALVKVGIYATKGNELVIPTVYATIGIVLKGADPSGDTSAEPTLPVWAQIQALIGNLNDLNTEAKNNLVAAINEAAQTGSGGASIAMRVDGGYIQYSTDKGNTWVNLIAEADLKGKKGDKGTDGHTPVKGTDYWTAADKAEIVNGTKNAIDLSSYAKLSDLAPLTGTTAELTPSQVRDAVLAGRPVVVQCADSEYGVLKFTNFNLAPSNSLIASVAIIRLSDAWVVYALYGYTLNQQWTHGITQMATGSDMNAIETSVDAVGARVATLESAGYLTLATLPKYEGATE